MLWWTLRQLTTKNSKTRERAAQKLGEIRDSRAVEPLIAALKDSADDVKKAAVEALAKIGDVRAIEPLVALLSDGNDGVQMASADALVQIGDVRAIELLVAALKDNNWSVQWVAAEALVRIGTSAIEPLIAVLSDTDSSARKKAVGVLGKIGDARAVEPLIVVLKESDHDLRKEAVQALMEIGYEPKSDKEKLLFFAAKEEWDQLLQAYWEATDSIKSVVVSLLIDGLGSRRDEDSLSKAAWALGETREPIAIEHLIALLQEVGLDACKRALVGIGDSAVEPLIGVLRNIGQDQVHAADGIGWVLGEIRDQRAIDPLIYSLRNNTMSLGEAAMALAKIGDPRAIAPLIENLKKSKSYNEVADVFTALAKLGEGGVKALVSVLSSCGPQADSSKVFYFPAPQTHH